MFASSTLVATEGGDGSTLSYSVDKIPNIAIDVALVDGPPSANGLLTRLTPLRWSATKIKPNGTIFLDDSAREGEQACLEILKTEFRWLRIEELAGEKGLAKLTREKSLRR